jgi:regulatory protein
MRITDFKTTKQGRIALFADGAFLFSVHPETFASMGLSVGCELDEDAIHQLEAETELKKAKEKALTLLSYKEYTTHQLEDRRLRHVREDAAQQAVRRMEELGLLDDDDYAVAWRGIFSGKRFGICESGRRWARGLSENRLVYAFLCWRIT